MKNAKFTPNIYSILTLTLTGRHLKMIWLQGGRGEILLKIWKNQGKNIKNPVKPTNFKTFMDA